MTSPAESRRFARARNPRTGEHDYQLREEFLLRRVRAGRARIPFGAGTWLTCRAYVRDVARGVRLALESSAAAGEVLNLCEDRSFSMRLWAHMILDAAGSDAELVRVADEVLPEDLKPTGTMTQHIAASGQKARAMLGWTTSDPTESLRTTVRWHLTTRPRNRTSTSVRTTRHSRLLTHGLTFVRHEPPLPAF